MSAVHEQTMVDAPVETVWELVGNPKRYPEWFPRVFEINGERYEEGAELVMATRQPVVGREDIPMQIDHLDHYREIRMHCRISGMFVHWELTNAQGGTFLDAEFGMDPERPRDRAFDFTLGRRFFRRWLTEAVDGLRKAATE
jgi:uncharacterized protein YndB with AHSA1/START domain